MKDKVRVANHPIHPMLIPFPIGLWIFSLVADIVYLYNGNPSWATAALYTMGGGIIGALLAAVPGFVDYLYMGPSRTKNIALWHMLLNVGALVLFVINFFMRLDSIPGATGPFLLSIIGVVGILISGWLGGHLVYVDGMAVDEANVCREPAHQHVTR